MAGSIKHNKTWHGIQFKEWIAFDEN